MTKAVNKARCPIRFNIVIDNTNIDAHRFEKAQHAGKPEWKAPARPGDRGVLHKHPSATPVCRLEPQGRERLPPTVNLPGHTAYLQINLVRIEGSAKIPAIFFDGVGRLVFAAK